MKLNAQINHSMRARLDLQLMQWKKSPPPTLPRKGWLKSIRESLGISSRQAGELLGKSNVDILAIEKRETQGTVTLETLEKTAAALGCRLVYVLIPENGSLEEKLDLQARQTAKRIMNETRHSMWLEGQNVDDAQMQAQIEDLARELKQKMHPLIWKEK